jgi:hypothetical protein
VSHLKALPVPDGFELREARADKTSDGRKWMAEDALFSASEALTKDPPAVAFIVAWYTRGPNGGLLLKYRCAFESEQQQVALATHLLHDLVAG